MENEVNITSDGISFATLPNTWLSVITSFGFFPRFWSVSQSSSSLTTTAVAPASSTPRIVCCCGRISLPFGAALSIGTTRTAKSPISSRSSTKGYSGFFCSIPEAIFSFSSRIWRFFAALTHNTGIFCPLTDAAFSALSLNCCPFWHSSSRSALFMTRIQGICFFSICFSNFCSSSVIPSTALHTRSTISVLFNTW